MVRYNQFSHQAFLARNIDHVVVHKYQSTLLLHNLWQILSKHLLVRNSPPIEKTAAPRIRNITSRKYKLYHRKLSALFRKWEAPLVCSPYSTHCTASSTGGMGRLLIIRDTLPTFSLIDVFPIARMMASRIDSSVMVNLSRTMPTPNSAMHKEKRLSHTMSC